jgi:hypothetical protein
VNSAVLIGLVAILLLFLFPAFPRLASAFLQLAFGCSSGVLRVLGHLVSGFARLKGRGIPIAFLSLALGLSLPFTAVRATADGQ